MFKVKPSEAATELWRWMALRRITLEELAAEVGCTRQHLSDVRRGVHRPGDDLKSRIAQATIELEERLGLQNPIGVPVTAWFAAANSKQARRAGKKGARA